MDTPSDAQIDQLQQQIDLIPELAGAGIAFVGDNTCTVLRGPRHSSGLKTYVVLQEDDAPGPPEDPRNPPSVLLELAGVGLNCIGAVAAWSAMGGETIAAAGSGGAAALLIPVTYAATWATRAQCAVSLIRANDVIFNDGHWTRWMDSQEFYPWASGALDAMSLGGAAVSATAAVRAAQAIRRATGRSWTEVLKGLSRADRKRLTEEIVRLQKPGASGRVLKTLVRMGAFPKRLQSAEITARLFAQLKDSISGVLSFGSSGTSGLLHQLYVHIVQE